MTQVFWKPGYSDQIEVRFPEDVSLGAAAILNQVINLPAWEYLILVEELNKLMDGPALRSPQLKAFSK